MAFKTRRVVTGLNGEGKSCVISDLTLDQLPSCQEARAVVWRTEGYPVNSHGNTEASTPFDVALFETSSSLFMMRSVEPGQTLGWHATDTIDYVIILKGAFRLGLEAGRVEVRAGDLVIDRGVLHSWTALGNEEAVLLAVLLRAEPVGRGASYGEVFART